MTRRKKSEGASVPEKAAIELAERLKRSLKNYETQAELAKWLGVEQPTVSRFLGLVPDPPKKKKPYRPGADVVATICAKYHLDYWKLMAGELNAGKWEGLDSMLPNRGRALDILSEEFPDELLVALKNVPPPEGHQEWTPIRWLEHLLSLKRAWEAGDLDLPGLKRTIEPARR